MALSASSSTLARPQEAGCSNGFVGDKCKCYEGAETFVAGALAGLIAESIMHPLDTISHRAKVGMRGFAGASGHARWKFLIVAASNSIGGFHRTCQLLLADIRNRNAFDLSSYSAGAPIFSLWFGSRRFSASL